MKFLGWLFIRHLFAPVGLLLGIASITVPWETPLTSVVLYIVIPVFIAQLIRHLLMRRGQATFDLAMPRSARGRSRPSARNVLTAIGRSNPVGSSPPLNQRSHHGCNN
jgi:hypothetical protein